MGAFFMLFKRIVSGILVLTMLCANAFVFAAEVDPLDGGLSADALIQAYGATEYGEDLFFAVLDTLNGDFLPDAVPGQENDTAAGIEFSIAVQPGSKAGEHKAVVSVAGNPGIAGYNLGIRFDKNLLTPVSIQEGSTLTGGMIFMSNLSGATEDVKASLDVATAMWVATGNKSGNGVVFTVLFREDTAAVGATPLTLESKGVSNANKQSLMPLLVGASVMLDGSGEIGRAHV